MNFALLASTQTPLIIASAVDCVRFTDALAEAMGDEAAFAALRDGRMGLISPYCLGISADTLRAIRDFVRALTEVTAHPAVRERALALSRAENMSHGRQHPWILSLDFHLTPVGPKLIEINTNPGGLMIAAAHARASGVIDSTASSVLECNIIDAFKIEWELAEQDRPLTRIAIIDDDPINQFLYPEFLLYRDLLVRHGIDTLICDPNELNLSEGRLMQADYRIDLVYNRLTDFYFEEPRHAFLGMAYELEKAVVTPDPAAYAANANKRLMTLFCDRDALMRFGVAEAVADTILAAVPHTVALDKTNSDELWSARRSLFFKPARGHAGKAAYRGDRISRATWERLDLESYIAQDFVPAPRVQVSSNETIKADLRVFTCGGDIIFTCARLYEGQTTNFRTPGGGFASIKVI